MPADNAFTLVVAFVIVVIIFSFPLVSFTAKAHHGNAQLLQLGLARVLNLQLRPLGHLPNEIAGGKKWSGMQGQRGGGRGGEATISIWPCHDHLLMTSFCASSPRKIGAHHEKARGLKT